MLLRVELIDLEAQPIEEEGAAAAVAGVVVLRRQAVERRHRAPGELGSFAHAGRREVGELAVEARNPEVRRPDRIERAQMEEVRVGEGADSAHRQAGFEEILACSAAMRSANQG